MSAPRRHAAVAEREPAALRRGELGGWARVAPNLYWHHWAAAVALD